MSDFLMIFAVLASHALVFCIGFKMGAHNDGQVAPE